MHRDLCTLLDLSGKVKTTCWTHSSWQHILYCWTCEVIRDSFRKLSGSIFNARLANTERNVLRHSFSSYSSACLLCEMGREGKNSSVKIWKRELPRGLQHDGSSYFTICNKYWLSRNIVSVPFWVFFDDRCLVLPSITEFGSKFPPISHRPSRNFSSAILH